MEDVRKTGPKGLKGLNYNTEQEVEVLDFTPAFQIGRLPETYGIGQDTPILSSSGDLGRSRFDEDILTMEQVEDVENMRALNQSTIGKWTSGIAKGAVLAGTTFLDGTLGLLWGATEMLANIGNKNETGWETFSRLWDNEFSNGMQEINKMSEQLLPNYRTKEERDREWYKNLGTANFWADTFLKNMGFTVGAAYSGKGFSTLMGKTGLIKSGLGAATAGAVYGAINEARIEANNNSDDFYKLETQKLQDAYKTEFDAISNSAYNIETKNALLNQLDVKYKALEEDLNVRKSKMGLGTFIGNSVFLSLNDFYTLGRFYAKGYQNAKRTGKSLRATADDLFAADQGIGKRVTKENGKWVADEITKKEAFGIGAKKALLEGNEELFQKFISGTSGEMYNTDSPDAYYNASMDEDAKAETEGFLGALLKGFKDSYGNGDSYEEFAVGFLTGALGIPSFGRVNNADASTFLGQGKSFGISGGLFGELSMAGKANQEMKEAVDFMNQYEEKLKTNKNHFVQSQYFTNAMSGWSETNNAFEYKNMEDNDDFVAISRYAAMGKLDHLKALVNQDFENISDETLKAMARETSTDTSGWYDVDGNYTSDGEDGAKKMREELTKKRDQILSNISKYENAVRETQSISNTALTNDQLNELAWLKWKGDRFVERYAELKKEFPTFYSSINESLDNWVKAIEELEKDESYDKKTLNETKRVIDNLKGFIEIINGSKNLYALSNFLDENTDFINDIISEQFYEAFGKHKALNYADYQKALTIMIDVAKIANAYKTFDTRYKEFVENPLKVQNKRSEDTVKKTTQQKATDKSKAVQEIEALSNNELLSKIDSGEVSLEDLQDIVGFDDIDLESAVETEAQKKVQQIADILEAREDASNELMRRFQSGEIDEQQLNDGIAILENSFKNVEEYSDFLNMDLESALDAEVLPDNDVERVLTNYERQEHREERLESTRSLLNDVKHTIESKDKGLTERPAETPEGTSTGHDATGAAQTVQQNQLEKKLTEEANKDVKELLTKASTMVSKEDSIPIKDAILRIVDSARSFFNNGLALKDSFESLRKFPQYQTLSKYPEVLKLVGDYIKGLYKPSETKPQTSGLEIKDLNDEIDTSITPDEVKTQNKEIKAHKINDDSKKYWGVSTTEYPIHREDGTRVPYYEVAKNVKNADGSPRYTEEQLKRMEEVYKFLDKQGAFALRNSQQLAVGESIQFAVYPKLNDDAGDFVVIMLDSKGRVVGDLIDLSYEAASTYPNLKEVVEAIKSEYNDWVKEGNTGERFISSKYKSQINQLMVGRVEYSEQHHSLNEIFTVIDSTGNPKQLPYKIGVVYTADGGRYEMTTTSESTASKNDPIGQSTIRPLKAKKGQPFLLIPTNDPARAYMPVPFAMPRYNASTSQSGLGKLVENVLNELLKIESKEDAVKVKNKLTSLLGNVWKGKNGFVESPWHIDRKSILVDRATDAELKSGITFKEQRIITTISYVPNKGGKALFTFTIDPTDPNSIETLKQELFKHGIPFRLTRKYLNKKIDGQDYNTLIGELASTNVEPGYTTTTNNWFTINPVNPDGTIVKAKKIKSTKVNPTANTIKQSNTKTPIEWNGKTYYVDSSWNVSDNTGKVFEKGDNTKKFLGYAWGIINGLDMTKPYNTEWGMYDPTKKQYIPKEEPKTTTPQQEQPEQKPQQPLVVEVTKEDLINNLKLKGVFNTPKKQQLAEALTQEQLSTIDNLTELIAIQVVNKLEFQFNGRTKTFKVDPNTIINSVKNREALATDKLINVEKEVKWLNKVLPQYKDKVHLVEGLIKIANGRNSDRAYGQFFGSTIVLSNVAAEGTVYHEAFHAVTNTILTNAERLAMFEEARLKYGNKDNIALEEALAEDFRKYIMLEEMFGGKIVKFYRKIKHFVTSFFGKENLINSIYYNISQGVYAERAITESMVTRNKEVDLSNLSVEDLNKIKEELKELPNKFKNNTELVDTIAGNKILKKSLGLGIYDTNVQKDATYLTIDYNRLDSIIASKTSGNNNYVTPNYVEPTKSKEELLSDSALAFQDYMRDRDDYDDIEDYHTNKYAYENMSDSDRYYVKSIGFNEDLWNKLNPETQKAIMECR